MLSAANQSIVHRDRDLLGLEALLDAERTAEVLRQCGLPPDGPLHIDYLRYKPGRRCISLVRARSCGATQQFVLSAFPKPAFMKQHARTVAAETQGRCWQDPIRQIRIERFPFDLGLRHFEKCFEHGQRSRLLRRVLGRKSCHDQIRLETLAYKPGRRYVAAAIIDECDPSSNPTEPLHTFKFYSGSQFSQTLQRLQTIRLAYAPAPRVVANHPHYRVIAVEWIQGQLLADLVAHGRGVDALLFEVGSELARLHRTPIPHGASPAAPTHELQEIASYIGFICPSQSKLAIHTVAVTAARLFEFRKRHTMIHGDFYAKQVLVDRGKVRFIDFDQAGLGNPYQDVGNFVAKLYWQQLVLGQSFSTVESMTEAFLLGYRSHSDSFDENAFRVHLSAGLIRCATHPFRRAMADWPNATHQLLKLAQSFLQSAKSPRGSVSIA